MSKGRLCAKVATLFDPFDLEKKSESASTHVAFVSSFCVAVRKIFDKLFPGTARYCAPCLGQVFRFENREAVPSCKVRQRSLVLDLPHGLPTDADDFG
jgi:hypothetical protein